MDCIIKFSCVTTHQNFDIKNYDILLSDIHYSQFPAKQTMYTTLLNTNNMD